MRVESRELRVESKKRRVESREHGTSRALCSRLSTLNSRLFPLILLLAGCSRDIESTYGQREGVGAWNSVNGTSVLGRMFEQAGHRVSSWGSLSPRLDEKADCIVWFPNDSEPPSEAVCRWLDDWLAADPNRTLIYVGGDFDAEPFYWEHVLADAPPDQQELIRKRLDNAKSRLTPTKRRLDKPHAEKPTPDKPIAERPTPDEPPKCEWFTVDTSKDTRRVRSLQGRSDWLEGIDPKQLEIELRHRLILPKKAEVLLKSDGDALVSRFLSDGGQRIVVVNGSFLLNVPLVNHEHRKLAAKLIECLPAENQRVVFLESYADGPPIRDDDNVPEPTGWEVFSVWPTNWILLHLAVVGVLFCFARWPIFGRPRELETSGRSDFGRHIDAMADLLRRTRDRTYATKQIDEYRQMTGQEPLGRGIAKAEHDEEKTNDQ